MKNSKAKTLLYLGYIVILAGVLAGLVWSMTTNDIIYLLVIGLSSIVAGLLLVGFSEVIELLQKIYNCQPNCEKTEENTTESIQTVSTGGPTTDRNLEEVSIWQLREEAKQSNSENKE